jgi:uncharacterized membrane protein
VARLNILSSAQRIAVVIAAVFYIVAGSLHFIKPAPYLRIMPHIPWHAVAPEEITREILSRFDNARRFLLT